MLPLALLLLVVALAGSIWMAIVAFHQGDNLWALGCIVLPGLIPIAYGCQNFEIARIPTILCFIGLAGRILIRVVEA